jgi:hypothetical protein
VYAICDAFAWTGDALVSGTKGEHKVRPYNNSHPFARFVFAYSFSVIYSFTQIANAIFLKE